MTYEPLMVPPPPPKRRSTLRIVLIVVAVVLAVCCLGGGGVGFWLYRTYQNSAGPARETTVSYVDEVRAGDYTAAYGRLCAKVRAVTSQEEFARIQSAQLKVTSYEISGVSVSNYNGRVQAAVTARMTQETGATFVQTFPLVKEDGEWRICQ
jgi:hypothetical protein